jgi:hypothetical protein
MLNLFTGVLTISASLAMGWSSTMCSNWLRFVYKLKCWSQHISNTWKLPLLLFSFTIY